MAGMSTAIGWVQAQYSTVQYSTVTGAVQYSYRCSTVQLQVQYSTAQVQYTLQDGGERIKTSGSGDCGFSHS